MKKSHLSSFSVKKKRSSHLFKNGTVCIFLCLALFLSACGGTPSLQKYPLKLSLFGPIAPCNPGAMLRLYPGTCFVSADVAAPGMYRDDNNWLAEKLDEIRKQEEV